ncbi:MAG: hypothetical protein K2Q20_12475 [Phycisphaerales bacterium]|nr:hypothetical protein [Phycisphaerales bacterium]
MTTSTSRPRLTVSDWAFIAAGLAIIALGGYLIWSRGGRSPTGMMIAAFGATVMPLAWVRLLGGLALGGVCVWLVFHALGVFDYALAAIAGVIGLTTVREAAAGLRGSPRDSSVPPSTPPPTA